MPHAPELVLLAALAALCPGAPEPARGPAQTPPQRPRDPWVFRSVLDERPRMVTIALSSELWAAYDATHCSLYKAWKGGVRFDGAVYTTVHGPQPTSEGVAYVSAPDSRPWQVRGADGAVAPARPRWLGYVLADGQVRLRYEFALAGGALVRVEETPEFVRPEKLFDDPTSQAPWLVRGLAGLRRTFTASGLPEGVELGVLLEAECAGFLMERMSGAEDVEVQLADGSKGRRVKALLPLDAARPRNEVMLFFRPPPEEKPK